MTTTSDHQMAQLEADIARTREDLAETGDQLAAKLDIKSRVRERISTAMDNARSRLRLASDHLTGDGGKPTPTVISAGSGVVAALAAVILVRLWTLPSRPKARGRWRR
jgi:hypothetical protein